MSKEIDVDLERDVEGVKTVDTEPYQEVWMNSGLSNVSNFPSNQRKKENLHPIPQNINLLLTLPLHQIIPLPRPLLPILPLEHKMREDTASK